MGDEKDWNFLYIRSRSKKLEQAVPEMNRSINPLLKILHQLGAEIQDDQAEGAMKETIIRHE